MITTVELTLYPLQDEYLPVIKQFIEHLHSYEGIQLQTVPTCTIMMGEHDLIFDVLKTATRWSKEHQGKVVFVSKILPGYEAL